VLFGSREMGTGEAFFKRPQGTGNRENHAYHRKAFRGLPGRQAGTSGILLTGSLARGGARLQHDVLVNPFLYSCAEVGVRQVPGDD